MTKFTIGTFVALVALAGVATNATQTGPTRNPVLELCEVKPEEEVLLSAEEAGVLVQLAVKDGSMPKAGDVIGQIDDRQAKLQMEAAKYGHDAAKARAESPIEIRYAEASSKVAQAEYEMNLDANRRTPNSVALIEIKRAELQWRTTELQIEKAKHDQSLAVYDVGAKGAEVELGKLAVERRSIEAPFNGVVVEILRHQNEWVNPGDHILRFARLDTMRVEQQIDVNAYDPQELANCNVTVEVKLARGRTATFTGKVTYVSPQLDYANRYKVRAEVANRLEAGQWLLRPNSQATMTIHLGTGAAIGVGQRPR